MDVSEVQLDENVYYGIGKGENGPIFTIRKVYPNGTEYMVKYPPNFSQAMLTLRERHDEKEFGDMVRDALMYFDVVYMMEDIIAIQTPDPGQSLLLTRWAHSQFARMLSELLTLQKAL